MLKHAFSFFILFFFCLNSNAQNNVIYVYDYNTGTLDSLPPITIDSTITEGISSHNIGTYCDCIAELPQTTPTENLIPNTNFTNRTRVEEDFELTDYPIRTTVKIWDDSNNLISGNLTGQMISRRHVLTTATGFVSLNDNSVTAQPLYVCPSYNNGEESSEFNCSYVKKVYFMKDYLSEGQPAAIVELEEPIGNLTGWIGVGYDQNEDFISQGVLYKFSYPNNDAPIGNSENTNGDSLYYSYGEMETLMFSSESFGVPGANSAQGEGGSSAIMITDDSYASYGVTFFASSMSHVRFNNWFYHNVLNIIEDDLVLGIENEKIDFDLEIWPNPTMDQLNVRGINLHEVTQLAIFDVTGKEVPVDFGGSGQNVSIETKNLPEGLYFLKMQTVRGFISDKFIKLRN